jgi:hypothetical protein
MQQENGIVLIGLDAFQKLLGFIAKRWISKLWNWRRKTSITLPGLRTFVSGLSVCCRNSANVRKLLSFNSILPGVWLFTETNKATYAAWSVVFRTIIHKFWSRRADGFDSQKIPLDDSYRVSPTNGPFLFRQVALENFVHWKKWSAGSCLYQIYTILWPTVNFESILEHLKAPRA